MWTREYVASRESDEMVVMIAEKICGTLWTYRQDTLRHQGRNTMIWTSSHLA